MLFNKIMNLVECLTDKTKLHSVYFRFPLPMWRSISHCIFAKRNFVPQVLGAKPKK